MRHVALLVSVAILSALAAASPALAITFNELSSFTTSPVAGPKLNGIAQGPDGTMWVAMTTAGKVAKVTPSGVVTEIALVPSSARPTGIAVASNGLVWVALVGAKAIARIDPANNNQTNYFATPEARCGPVAVQPIGDVTFFSNPDDGACSGAGSFIGKINANGTGMTSQAGLGTAFSLATVNGKLFVPDFYGNVIRRVGTALVSEATIAVAPGGDGPSGIAVGPGGTSLYVTLFYSSQVASFPVTAGSGQTTTLPLPSATLVQPVGIATGSDGNLWVASSGNDRIVRVTPAGVATPVALPAGSQPWQVAAGPDETVWVTELTANRVARVLPDVAPRAGAGSGTALSSTTARLTGTADPRGNATDIFFRFGTTPAYGSETTPRPIGSGVGEVESTADLAGLAPSTTYHLQVVARNAFGTVAGPDRIFTTPATEPPPIPPVSTPPLGSTVPPESGGTVRLPARIVLTTVTRGATTTILRLVVDRLPRGATISIACKAPTTARRACPFTRKRSVKAPAGKVKYDATTRLRIRAAKLRTGAKVTITVTAPGAMGRVQLVTARTGRAPLRQNRCLVGGRVRACPAA